ncbi:MAG: bifunctional phosphoglucose/phosphomannose isomerase, partial [Candidatus Latescibacteria bacterium]|nr:bifunctional phosphoglucose/phosphomannose isomerase [bacterium]MBD3424551.1 bifunctional phosphoglucose/phosphomannose isomerase [Candidatus Latescibacterota bacterium]
GMGGSAIGASLARDLAGPECSFPVHVERGYSLPGFAGPDSTVISISYSGNTEEILALFRQAEELGCSLGAITSGGRLEAEAEGSGAGAVVVTGGLPPRAAIGCLFAPLVRILSGWGALKVDERDVEELIRTLRGALESLSPDMPDNPALRISEQLHGKIPLIYSGGGLLEAAAYRWKCQFNENSKVMAFNNFFPELGHNEVMGWDSPGNVREVLSVIMLTDRDDHPRVSRRMEITASMLEDLGVEVIRVDSSWFQEGSSSRLERLLSTVSLGDMASVYLALRRGVDPVPIERIETVKNKLRTE